MLQRELKTLANSKFSPEICTFSFVSVGLSNGMYIHQLQTAGFVQSRKILMLK